MPPEGSFCEATKAPPRPASRGGATVWFNRITCRSNASADQRRPCRGGLRRGPFHRLADGQAASRPMGTSVSSGFPATPPVIVSNASLHSLPSKSATFYPLLGLDGASPAEKLPLLCHVYRSGQEKGSTGRVLPLFIFCIPGLFPEKDHSFSNASLPRPQVGQTQSAGTFSQGVPGATPFSGSPTAGS